MKNASTITAFIISFLVVGSLALVFLFLDNKEEEPAAAEPAAQTEDRKSTRLNSSHSH